MTSENRTTFAVIDLETGGLKPAEHPILQVAVVLCNVIGRHMEIEHSWSSMVRLVPPWASIGAQHVHHISRRRLIFAPTLTQVMRRLHQSCEDRTIVAHNLAFDWSFLVAAHHTTGVPLPDGEHLCTLRRSRALDPQRAQTHRLADLCARYDVTFTDAHDALADATATAQVLPHLLRAQADG